MTISVIYFVRIAKVPLEGIWVIYVIQPIRNEAKLLIIITPSFAVPFTVPADVV